MLLVLVFNRTHAQYFAGYLLCTMSMHDLVGGYMKGGRSWSEINSIVTLITNKAHTWNFGQKISGGIPENTVISSIFWMSDF